MHKPAQGPSGVVKCSKLFAVVLGLVAFVSSQALAQTICHIQAVINFPNGDNLNRVVGQNLAVSISLISGPNLDEGMPDSLTFSVVHFFPSCLSVGGNVCTVDQGELAGAPPPVEYAAGFATNCSIVPMVDATDPFDIKFNFSPSITLANGDSCLLTFNVHVAERGDLGSTPASIQQLASADGVCGSGLTSSGTGSAQITLTCPPCDDGNVCTADACDEAMALCTHSTPPNCADCPPCTVPLCTPDPGDCRCSEPPNCDDGDICTVDQCTGPNPGDCSHSTPPPCDDGNICTEDACIGPNPWDCSHWSPCDNFPCAPCTVPILCIGPNPEDCRCSEPPNCDDGNVCTVDQCTGPNPEDCSHSTPPDCDDQNVCTADQCTGPNPGDCSHSSPPDCDDQNVCTADQCTGPNPEYCLHSAPPDCDDGNICTIDLCTGPIPGDCSHSTPPNCDDLDVCTHDECTGPNPGDCSHVPPPCPDCPPCSELLCTGLDCRCGPAPDCDDGNECTVDPCTGPNPGDCSHSTPPNCDDGDVCTRDECTGPNPGDCSHVLPPCPDCPPCSELQCTGPNPGDCRCGPAPDCDDGNECTVDQCIGPNPGDCVHSRPPNCDDANVCTTDACTGPNPGDCSYVPSDLSQTCGTSDACVDRGCDPTSGCYENDHSSECGSSEACVERGCDPATGCFERDWEPKPPECEGPQPGCRITAGGMTPDGGVDTAESADALNARFHGQVGAGCGCIGCSDSLDQIQGSWEASRKSRRGSFHALTFNSLVCGCDGLLDGELCRPDDAELGPGPIPAPANMACFSGIGNFNPTNGRSDIRVAFRVEVEDRGAPGVGKTAPDDSYRIRIWIPGQDETAEGLADQVCCTHAAPIVRDPDIDDGGNLIHGNIQIHPPLPNTVQEGCPVPDGACQQ